MALKTCQNGWKTWKKVSIGKEKRIRRALRRGKGLKVDVQELRRGRSEAQRLRDEWPMSRAAALRAWKPVAVRLDSNRPFNEANHRVPGP